VVFGVEDLGFRVEDLGFRVWNSGGWNTGDCGLWIGGFLAYLCLPGLCASLYSTRQTPGPSYGESSPPVDRHRKLSLTTRACIA
jgi:hypothetical protein